MNGEPQAPKVDYILGATQLEYERLRLQARAWEEATLRVLAGAGLQPGMRCLDVGCGPGEGMRLIGRIVAREGHVTGLDIDEALGAHMLAELRRDEGPQFDFVAGDITRGDPVPAAPFDLVFTRLLLCHMTNPVETVRRLGALVKPGGRLVLMDYDMSRTAIRPEDARVARCFEIVNACFSRSGRNPDSGLRLPGYLLSAGLPPAEGSDVAAVFGPFRLVGAMLRSVLTSLTAAACALGIADTAEIADLLAHARALEEADQHYGLGPLMIGVWTTPRA